MDESITEMRTRIDAIDRELVRLLHERARCAIAIGAQKRRLGLAAHDPEREAAILARIETQAEGPFPPLALRQIFMAIVAACRGLQER
ncbi:MAG: chorismate mutase [candidate division KSB1 bacterium]|nr:chorismate mutase [candidate division KSB1 bacterium]MDZ7337429.1 chorismate mutase [candidate division KSB1 bacterium]MDZ7379654.1 chorismate mutase [candidate division KSB1 bacterium]MDZ7385502.1 chorismate mutase [candidate division KSB1 bacterium]MDZ7393293.1 chorismate mutase [candidate division KSB1 bacterium]